MLPENDIETFVNLESDMDNVSFMIFLRLNSLRTLNLILDNNANIQSINLVINKSVRNIPNLPSNDFLKRSFIDIYRCTGKNVASASFNRYLLKDRIYKSIERTLVYHVNVKDTIKYSNELLKDSVANCNEDTKFGQNIDGPVINTSLDIEVSRSNFEKVLICHNVYKTTVQNENDLVKVFSKNDVPCVMISRLMYFIVALAIPHVIFKSC